MPSSNPGTGSRKLAQFFNWDPDRALPRLFLLLGAPIGLLFALLMPPLQIPDETGHLARAYAISQGTCLSPAHQRIPLALHALAGAFPSQVDAQRPASYSKLRAFLKVKGEEGGRLPYFNPAMSVYTCAPYLAAAGAVAVARMASLPVIVWLYSARLANLFLYLILVYWALRTAPIGRALLFCLALMPMSLHQAASASADAATIASAICLFAYVLFLAYHSRVLTITWRRQILLGALVLFVTQCKFNVWPCFLILLIPASRYGSLKRKMLVSVVMLGVALSVSAAWNYADHANIAAFQESRNEAGADVEGAPAFMLHHPVTVLATLVRSRIALPAYAQSFTGYFGTFLVPLPIRLSAAYLAFILLSALVSNDAPIRRRDRILALVVLAGAVTQIFAIMWACEMKQSYLATEIVRLHRGVWPGVQGRYFIPIAPVLVLILARGRRWKTLGAPIVLASVVLVVVTNGVAIARIQSSYYQRPAPAPQPPALASVPFFCRARTYLGDVQYLAFPNGKAFGYFTYTGKDTIDHFDLGPVIVLPSSLGAWFYDVATHHWFYTDPGLFPYLYDATLKTWLFYFPDPASPGRYSSHPRWFADMTTHRVFTM